MTYTFAAIRNNKFIMHNIVFFIGALVVGGLNYLYYPVLGRMLQPAVFGEVQTLVSLFLQLSVLFNVLGLLTVTLVTNQKDEQKRNKIIIELEKLSLYISIGLLFVVILAGTVLQNFFQFSSQLPFIVLALTIAVTVPFTFRTSYLRGHSLFGLNSWAFIIGAGTKLLFSVLFVLAGWGTTGAILGIALAQLVAFWYGAWQAKKHGFTESLRDAFFRLPDMSLVKPELKFAGLVLVCTLIVTLMYSADVVIVKHLFAAHMAGLYAGVAAVARIPFFLTASIAQVLMSSVRLSHTAAENKRILTKSTILMCVLGGGSAIFFWLFPQFTVELLMGSAYLPYTHLLPPLGLAVFVISLVNLFVTYHLALRHWTIGLVALGGGAATIILLAAWHSTPEQIVQGLLTGGLITAGLLLVQSGVGLITRKEVAKR